MKLLQKHNFTELKKNNYYNDTLTHCYPEQANGYFDNDEW